MLFEGPWYEPKFKLPTILADFLIRNKWTQGQNTGTKQEQCLCINVFSMMYLEWRLLGNCSNVFTNMLNFSQWFLQKFQMASSSELRIKSCEIDSMHSFFRSWRSQISHVWLLRCIIQCHCTGYILDLRSEDWIGERRICTVRITFE